MRNFANFMAGPLRPRARVTLHPLPVFIPADVTLRFDIFQQIVAGRSIVEALFACEKILFGVPRGVGLIQRNHRVDNSLTGCSSA